MKMRTRRVGTLTLGTTLIVFGILFMIRIFSNLLSYRFLMKLWPVIFIFLGCEILFYFFQNKEEKVTYDAAAILIIILLSFFAMGMAGAEFLMNHAQYQNIIIP
jgi:hypothetical protein